MARPGMTRHCKARLEHRKGKGWLVATWRVVSRIGGTRQVAAAIGTAKRYENGQSALGWLGQGSAGQYRTWLVSAPQRKVGMEKRHVYALRGTVGQCESCRVPALLVSACLGWAWHDNARLCGNGESVWQVMSARSRACLFETCCVSARYLNARSFYVRRKRKVKANHP